MSILFISHSRHDNAAAIRIRDWLKEHGWGEVFLDLDPERGMTPGRVWQQELKHAGERCAGVLVLLSPSWVDARWCQTEFLVAEQLGKKIFPILIVPMPFEDVPVELRAKYYILDISRPESEAKGFERLALGLKRAGLDPGSFEWPPPADPHRSIYRGLQSLDEEDAAIFFGRDGQITEGLDTLRRIRDGFPKRLLVIQGASGAGKSSFLKAGLIARLRRDEENFLVLPVMRPERAALSGEKGLAAVLRRDPSQLKGVSDVANALERLRKPVVDRLMRFAETAHETHAGPSPTIVIPIDQAEELFAAENTEAPHVLELLAGALAADTNTIVVATIRTDAFAKIQDEPRLCDVQRVPFDLSPMPHGTFKDVIEGPARVAHPPLVIEPSLTERLLRDLAADDALPLLAFTLERLLSRNRGKRTLTLADYTRELGGLQGAITAAVDEAFAKAQRDPALPHDRVELQQLARAAFIPALIQIDGPEAEPKRRVERIGALPEATRPLVRHMIDERLLVSDRRAIDGIESDAVEVAHEAILRQWPALRAWIVEERDALRALDGVRASAAEWKRYAAAGVAQSWLSHRGGRLDEAEALMARPDFANALGASEIEYIRACRTRENDENVKEKQGIARTRRLQRNIGLVVTVAAALVLIAGIGVIRILSGIAARSSTTLAEQAAKESDAGYFDRAARYALAGLAGSNWPLLGYDGSAAEMELASAVSNSRAVAVLRGHGAPLDDAAFSPDGRWIVTAADDQTARIWDVRTGATVAVLRGHQGRIRTAVFSPNGKLVVTASDDRTARIWNARTGRPIFILRGHRDTVNDARFSPDGLRIATASQDGTARIWNARTGRETAVLRGHTDFVYAALFSPDGKRVVTASNDNTARIWNAADGTQVANFLGHSGPILGVDISPDGRRVATASWDKTARVWDTASGRVIAIMRGHEGILNSVAFASDGSRIVTSSFDKTARVWDAETGKQLAVLSGHEDAVFDARFSPDGKRVVTASYDSTARVWDADTGQEIATLRGHNGIVDRALFSQDGKRLLTTSTDGTARIWNALAPGRVIELRGHSQPLRSGAFNADGTRVVTASVDATARIWNAETGREMFVLQGHKVNVRDAVFSPDSRRIVTASSDGTARLWDADTGGEIAILRGHDDIVYHALFSPDGKRILTIGRDKTARIWDANSGAQISVLRGHSSYVWVAAFSPDGDRIITGAIDNTARIWDSATGRTAEVLAGHQDQIAAVAFSFDGTRVVTASQDTTARIWNANNGRLLVVLRGHRGAVTDAIFSHDGTRVVTSSADNTARVWDSASGKQLALMRGHNDALLSAAFSPDGTRVLTASADNTARLWDAKTGREVAILRGHTASVVNAAFSADGTRILTVSEDGTARIWPVREQIPQPRLMRQVCDVALARGLSIFDELELRAAPVLDPRLDRDACHPPSLWSRLAEALSNAGH